MYTSHSCCNVYNIPSHLSKAPVDPSSPKDTVLTLRLWFLAATQPVQLIMTNTFSSAISCSDVSFCTRWVARSTVQSGLKRNLFEKALSDVSQCHFFFLSFTCLDSLSTTWTIVVWRKGKEKAHSGWQQSLGLSGLVEVKLLTTCGLTMDCFCFSFSRLIRTNSSWTIWTALSLNACVYIHVFLSQLEKFSPQNVYKSAFQLVLLHLWFLGIYTKT